MPRGASPLLEDWPLELTRLDPLRFEQRPEVDGQLLFHVRVREPAIPPLSPVGTPGVPHEQGARRSANPPIVVSDGDNRMAAPGDTPTFQWNGSSYGNALMSWRCKVGGSNGTYGTFTLKVNMYATGTTLYCPSNSKFDFVWPGSNVKTEFHAGSIKINGSSVHRAADLLTVAKASRDAEDFRQKLIKHLEEIVGRDAAEAKATAAVEENPPEPEIEPGPEEEPEEAPKRTRRKKSGD